MDAANSSRLRAAALNIKALAAGVVVATLSVTIYTFVEALMLERARGGNLLIPPETQALFALINSLVVAVFLTALCVPIWLLLARAKLDRWYVASALGFAAVMAYWTADNFQGSSVAEAMRSGLAYALCGAVAGLVTWRTRPRG